MPIAQSQMSFAGGVLSPLFVHRDMDMEPYAFGLRQSVNGIILETGAWTRRPGTYLAAQTKSNRPAYLALWEYNKSDVYQLEFTEYKLRFYRGHSLVTSGGVTYEIDTPFTEAELPYIQTFQKKEVLWIVTGERGVYKLTRTDDDDWDLDAADITDGPFEDTNDNASLKVALSATGLPGTAVTVTVTGGNLFQAGYVGALLRIDGTFLERKVVESITGVGVSATLTLLPIDATWEWIAITEEEIDVALQYSEDGATFSTYRALSMPSDAQSNFIWVDGSTRYMTKLAGSNTLNKAVYLRFAVTTGTTLGSSALTVDRADHSGVVQLTAYSSATQMSGRIVTEPAAITATAEWAVSSQNAVVGYPRALGFHDGRTVLGGTVAAPLRLDFGQAGEPEGFTTGMEDDKAFSYTLDRAQNRFNWIEGGWTDALVVGSEKGIMELVPYSEGGFTPTNPPAIRRTLILPTSRIPPRMVEDIMLVVGGDDGGQVFQIFSSTERGGIVPDDVTKYASHLGNFTGLAVQLGRRNLLWLPTDTYLAGCTYRPNLAAWHTHMIGDEVLSVCVAPTATGEELWLSVRRGTDYFIEYLDRIDLERATEDSHFMDCGVAWQGDSVRVTAVARIDPVRVTVAEWPEDSLGNALADGDYVRFSGGYADLEDQIFTVFNANTIARTLNLKDQTGTVTISGVGFAAFSSGTMEWVKNTITGMDHLDGEDLIALCDGTEVACVGGATVTFGTDIEDFYCTIHIGVEVTATIETLPPEFYLRSGSTYGKDKQLTGLTLSLYNSRGGRYAATGAKEQDIPCRRTAAQTQQIPALFTGKVHLGSSGGVFQDEMTVTMTIDGAYPFTLRGMTPQIEVR